MFIVSLPDNCRAERAWISAVLLGEFLGIPYEVRFGGERSVSIGVAGKTLEIADGFFARAAGAWLSSASLPDEPLKQWRIADSALAANTAAPSVPVLFGAPGFEMRGADNAVLHLDVFGSAFFMLSRYEEAASAGRDEHGRFPATASLACRQGFLDRPVVDEYVEILWAALARLWPALERKARRFRLRVSCDVDHPYHPGAASVARTARRMAGELLRTRSAGRAIRPLRNYLASRNGDRRHDPYYHTVDWMMDVNEKAGNTVAFYFIPEITDAVMDDTCPISDPAVAEMMKRIDRRGHEIGIHPGYHTYASGKRIASGKESLRRALQRERIGQEIRGGRQHYLRWSTATPALWDAAGLEYDSTLGYADRVGFRCGTCHEYPMFDLHGRRRLALRQRPLVCMECSVITYMGCGCTDAALAEMLKLKRAAQRFRGDFTLLWHNSFFEADRAKDIYREVISS